MRISDERLAEMREIAGKATPGPWVYSPYSSGNPEDEPTHHAVRSTSDADDSRVGFSVASTDYDRMGYLDAEHIAAFDPPTVLELLAELAEYRKRAAGELAVGMVIENGWLCEIGEGNYIPGYGYEPGSQLEPILDLKNVPGWPGEVTDDE